MNAAAAWEGSTDHRMVSLKSAHAWYSEEKEKDGLAIGSNIQIERKRNPWHAERERITILHWAVKTATTFDLVLLVVHADSQSRASTSAGWSSPWSFGNGTYPVHTDIVKCYHTDSLQGIRHPNLHSNLCERSLKVYVYQPWCRQAGPALVVFPLVCYL